tara:strand:- start:15602 stop:16261 length:660 start_codon:yes stop_codon:yes gene_type:complete
MSINGKKMILIGGNSSLVQDLILNKSIDIKYSDIIIISHRKYKGEKRDFSIIDNIDPLYMIEEFIKIFESSNDIVFDILVSNTPTQKIRLNSSTLEWAISSLKLMNFFSNSDKVNKAIFLGSVISFVPFYRDGVYKSIKKVEFELFNKIINNDIKKISFCILPPLSPGISGIGKLFSQSRSTWSRTILDGFDTNNRIIMPSSLIGIILRMIFFVKKIKI